MNKLTDDHKKQIREARDAGLDYTQMKELVTVPAEFERNMRSYWGGLGNSEKANKRKRSVKRLPTGRGSFRWTEEEDTKLIEALKNGDLDTEAKVGVFVRSIKRSAAAVSERLRVFNNTEKITLDDYKKFHFYRTGVSSRMNKKLSEIVEKKDPYRIGIGGDSVKKPATPLAADEVENAAIDMLRKAFTTAHKKLSDRELAQLIKTGADYLNDLVEQAKAREIMVKTHTSGFGDITVVSITKLLV